MNQVKLILARASRGPLGSASLITALLAVIAASPVLCWESPAKAIPAFAQQTGQPCEACHVGAFGPQLKPYGRDFKLFGYQSDDGKNHLPPIAVTVQMSETHTATAQSPPPAPHFGENDNFAIDQTSIYYGGRLPMGWGAFAQVTYDGVGESFNLDNVDFRRATQLTLFGQDSVAAFDINNNPTVEDPWNSAPAWGFPYNGSSLAPGANAAALIDGGLAHGVVGVGGYVLWNNMIYVDATAYIPLERNVAGRLGEGEDNSSDRWTGAAPYARIALVHDLDNAETQTGELGAFLMRAQRYPAGDVSAGVDTFSDWAVDANYQYIGSSRHVVSAHAIYIHEDQTLAASSVLSGTRPKNVVSTARADVSYSFANTWTPSVQLFATNGTFDPALYAAGAKTTGYVAELAYTPWGKVGSPFYWVNARFALQYVGYTEFNGVRHGAGDNNTLYANVWIALAPFGQMVHR